MLAALVLLQRVARATDAAAAALAAGATRVRRQPLTYARAPVRRPRTLRVCFGSSLALLPVVFWLPVVAQLVVGQGQEIEIRTETELENENETAPVRVRALKCHKSNGHSLTHLAYR